MSLKYLFSTAYMCFRNGDLFPLLLVLLVAVFTTVGMAISCNLDMRQRDLRSFTLRSVRITLACPESGNGLRLQGHFKCVTLGWHACSLKA